MATGGLNRDGGVLSGAVGEGSVERMGSEKADKNRDREALLGVDRKGLNDERRTAQMEEARAMSIEAARCLSDDKCEDVVVLDLRGLSQITDYFVIASGTSETQMRSSGEHVTQIGEAMGIKVHHSNLRSGPTKWYVVDFVNVVVHLFDPEERAYYDLEMLWGDADRVAWSREGGDATGGLGDSGRNLAGLREDDVLPGQEEG